jgi:hypothetical protein
MVGDGGWERKDVKVTDPPGKGFVGSLEQPYN